MVGRLVIQKYGGSSVETPEKIKGIAARIARLHREGTQVIVVVSAMGKTTDQLLGLATQITKAPQGRELDMLLTAGERISMSLLSMALNDMGVPAVSLTGSQSGIITTNHHTAAAIETIKPIRITQALQEGRVVLVAGFQGVSREKEVTTLGRGGSDTTAVALAAHFRAERCEILKDVDGVFTADPRVVTSARHIPKISTHMLLRMSTLGAKVLHYRAAALAMKYKVPLWLGNSVDEKKGTDVVPMEENMESPVILGLTGKATGVVLVTARGPRARAENWLACRLAAFEEARVAPALSWCQQLDDELVTSDVFLDVPLPRVEAWFQKSVPDFQVQFDGNKALVGVTGTDLARVGGISDRVEALLMKEKIPARLAFSQPAEAVWLVPAAECARFQQLLHTQILEPLAR